MDMEPALCSNWIAALSLGKVRIMIKRLSTAIVALLLTAPAALNPTMAAELDDRAAADFRSNIKRADTAHRVALERCRRLVDREKELCIEQAKAAHQQAKLHARAQARSAAMRGKTDPREADYRAALGRCEFYRGRSKDICVNQANAEYAQLVR